MYASITCFLLHLCKVLAEQSLFYLVLRQAPIRTILTSDNFHPNDRVRSRRRGCSDKFIWLSFYLSRKITSKKNTFKQIFDRIPNYSYQSPVKMLQFTRTTMTNFNVVAWLNLKAGLFFLNTFIGFTARYFRGP